jgi:hypothetical protein
VNGSGLVTAVAPGQAEIRATAGSKLGRAIVTVQAPVATITISPDNGFIGVGGTATFTATAADANGKALTGRTFTWSVTSAVTHSASGSTLVATGVGPGIATITASAEGKTGMATVVVASTPSGCSSANALQLGLGEVRTLTSNEVASLCIASSASGSEYVLIPFNNSSVASTTVPLTIVGTNATAVAASALGSLPVSSGLIPGADVPMGSIQATLAGETAFREMEERELAPRFAALHAIRGGATVRKSLIPGAPSTPAVGSVVSLNADLSSSCGPKQVHPARVVAVLPHTIVFLDNQSPAGGYTDAELTAFATGFDTLGFAIDTLNFGGPTDIDGNGRVGVFFTPGVNQRAQLADGGVVTGLFFSRDLVPATGTNGCAGSNEGEMFYLAVPDPNRTINANYSDKAFLGNNVPGVLAHEFQHMINAGRRLYVNNAARSEEIWLNEGLSHIAEELLYYRISGNNARANIAAPLIGSSSAQINAFNSYAGANFSRLATYLKATESNSPYSSVDALAMRGAIWQLLRYAADRKGGTEATTWRSLVNSTSSGGANVDAVFGNLVAITRDWAVAQFADDAGFNVPSAYTHSSWNYRSVLGGTTAGWELPKIFRALKNGEPQNLTLVGGGAAYVRFRVNSGVLVQLALTSSTQPVPPTLDFILVRTQ